VYIVVGVEGSLRFDLLSDWSPPCFIILPKSNDPEVDNRK